MTSAAQHLFQYGVSMEDANAFVMANIGQPQVIYNVAFEFGVTNAMLGEIAGGYAETDVEAFFLANGIDSRGLDGAPPAPAPDGGIGLIPEEWLSLAPSLVALNTDTGVLSNASIRAQVISSASLTEAAYWNALNPMNWADPGLLGDGRFSIDELGFSHLGDLAATAETVESLIYGSIIKVVRSIDMAEVMSLENFVTTNELALANMDPAATNQLLTLMANVLSTPANPPLVSDVELSAALGFAGAALVGVFESGTLPGLDGLLPF